MASRQERTEEEQSLINEFLDKVGWNEFIEKLEQNGASQHRLKCNRTRAEKSAKAWIDYAEGNTEKAAWTCLLFPHLIK